MNLFYVVNTFLFWLLKEEKYHVGRIFTFQGPCGTDLHGNHSVLVKFMLPQQEKLAVETNYDKYFLCILASGMHMVVLIQLFHEHV